MSEHYDDLERRVDQIGQNGNTGEHYDMYNTDPRYPRFKTDKDIHAEAAGTGVFKPKPRVNVVPEVMKDLVDRMAKGTKEYGVPLQTNNGRDALLDAYEEVLDLACYLKQRMMEEK